MDGVFRRPLQTARTLSNRADWASSECGRGPVARVDDWPSGPLPEKARSWRRVSPTGSARKHEPGSMKKLRIVLAGHHSVVRQGFRREGTIVEASFPYREREEA